LESHPEWMAGTPVIAVGLNGPPRIVTPYCCLHWNVTESGVRAITTGRPRFAAIEVKLLG
jgi:hypothetical protein